MSTMNIFDMTDTWNAGATTFTAVKMNVTDTASGSGSLLVDLQVGGSSKFSVTKAGAVTSSAGAGISSAGSFFSNNGGGNTSYLASTGVFLSLAGALNFSGNVDGATSPDVTLTRDAADTLAQRRGTNAQASRLYGTYSDVSNLRRLAITSTTGGAFTLSAEGLGTGVTGNTLAFSTDGTSRWSINSSGHLVPAASNTYDIGTDGTATVRYAFVGTATYSPFFVVPNFGQLGPGGGDGRLTLYNTLGTDFLRLQFGGTTNSFPAIKRDGAGVSIVGGADGSTAHIKVPGVTVASLPAAATAGAGARAFVTDALAPVFGSAVVGGGAVAVPVYSTGSAWHVG